MHVCTLQTQHCFLCEPLQSPGVILKNEAYFFLFLLLLPWSPSFFSLLLLTRFIWTLTPSIWCNKRIQMHCCLEFKMTSWSSLKVFLCQRKMDILVTVTHMFFPGYLQGFITPRPTEFTHQRPEQCKTECLASAQISGCTF